MKFRAIFILLLLAATAGAQLRAPKATPTKPGAPKATPVKPTPTKPVPAAKPAKPVDEPDPTAIGALKLLPKDMARRVARIEAREGHPWPERWYVLVFDPAAPQGLREFVFSEGKMLTGRTLSQFADSLAKEDAVGAEAIRINNDTAAGMAAQFAIANGKRLGTVEYALRKAAPGVAVWRLTCTDSGGRPMGVVELHAGKGTVVSFEGFENSPVAVQPLPPVKTPLAVKAKAGKPGEKVTSPKPVGDSAPTAKPKPEKTAAETPPTQNPGLEKPVAVAPSEPVTPLAEHRAAEKPKTPPSDQPASERPLATFGDRPFGEKRLAEKPHKEKSTAEQPAAGKPALEKSITATPPKTDPIAKKPLPPIAEPPKAVPVARAVPAPAPEPGAVKRIGNSVKRLFGRDE